MSTNNSTEGSPSPSPVAPNAPKFGTLVPNRIFVGGISASTTELELHALFSNYGNVKATKIISDRAGVSKGYGFVTFETEEEARRIQKDADNIVLKDRKLNIAPAIKKQPFTRVYGDESPTAKESTQAIPNGTILYHNGIPCMYHNGMAFFITPENLYHVPQPQVAAAAAAAAYPVIYPQPVYIAQQQYQFQSASPSQWTSGQWHWASPTTSSAYSHPAGGGPESPTVPAASYVYTTLPPAPAATAVVSTSTTSTAGSASELYQYAAATMPAVSAQCQAITGHNSVPTTSQTSISTAYSPQSSSSSPSTSSASVHPEYAEVTSAMETGNVETHKSHHSKKNAGGTNYSGSPRKSYNSMRVLRSNAGNIAVLSSNPSSGDTASPRTVKQFQAQQPHLVPKTVNGVTIMAYPTAVAQGYGKDHCMGDHENLPIVTMADVGLMHHHAPLSGNPPLSPPPTPLSPVTSELPGPNMNETARRLQVLTL